MSAGEVRIVRKHKDLVGGQKLAEDVFIFPHHPPNQLVRVVDEVLRVEVRITVEDDPTAKQSSQRLLVLEHLLGGVVAEVFAEELQETRFFDGLVVENADDLFANLRGGLEIAFVRRLQQRCVRFAIGEGEGDGPGEVMRSQHRPAVFYRLDPINQSRGAQHSG